MGSIRFLAVAAAAVAAPLLAPKSAEAFPPKIEVQAAAPTGSQPKGVTLSPDGRRLYVTSYGVADKDNVSVYDATSLALIEKIDVPGTVAESAMAPDGKTLYVTNGKRNSVQFVDLEGKKVAREVKAGMHPKGLAVSHDGKRLFAAGFDSDRVSVIDTKSGDVVRSLATEKNPHGIAITKDGRLYVANFGSKSIDIFEGAEFETHRRLKDICKNPRHLVLAPDESKLYVSCLLANQVAVLDTKKEEFIQRVQVGRFPKAMDVTPDGRYVVTADYRGSSVSIVDTTDWSTRTLDIPSMDAAGGIVVAKPIKASAKEAKLADAKAERHASGNAKTTHAASSRDRAGHATHGKAKDDHAREARDQGHDGPQPIKLGARAGTAGTAGTQSVSGASATTPTPMPAHPALRFFVTGWYDNHVYSVGVAGSGPRYSVDSQTAQLTLKHRRIHLKHASE